MAHAVVQFVRGLPESLDGLRREDAAYLVQHLQQDGPNLELSTMQATEISRRLGTERICSPADFCLRLAQALSLVYELDSVPIDAADHELSKLLETFRVRVREPKPKADDENAFRWEQPRLAVPARFLAVCEKRHQLQEAVLRKKLLHGLPLFDGLTKAPINNTKVSVLHDQQYSSWYNQLRDVQRCLLSLHLTLSRDVVLSPYLEALPPSHEQLENCFGLVVALAQGISNFRLRQIDQRLLPEKEEEPVLVQKEDLRTIEARTKMDRTVRGRGKGTYFPTSYRYSPYGAWHGRGKGFKGKGKSGSYSGSYSGKGGKGGKSGKPKFQFGAEKDSN